MGRCGWYQGCKGKIDPMNIAEFDFSAGWIVEEKFDGHWVSVEVDGSGKVDMISSTGKLKLNEQLNSLYDYLHKTLGRYRNSVFIGELDFGTERGTLFAASHGHHRVNLFDMICINGHKLAVSHVSTVERKEGLHRYLEDLRLDPLWVRESEYRVVNTAEQIQYLFDETMRRNLEGLVVKKPWDYEYYGNGQKNPNWYKIKKIVDMDYVIMGYKDTSSDNYEERGWIGSLILGLYENGVLVEKSNCDGMTQEERSYFSANKAANIGRVVVVRGNDVTGTGAIRHPRFYGFRDDKDPSDCVWPS